MEHLGQKTGVIFNIQKFCIDDGPGIRTTVFLKGCPLRCTWCHNLEGLSPKVGLELDTIKCTHCGKCSGVCKQGCHQLIQDLSGIRHEMDLTHCIHCKACLEQCPQEALLVCGSEKTVDEVIQEVLVDRKFYENSGGGMTLSGGEPLLQGTFAQALLERAKEVGLHTCVETSGAVSTQVIEEVAPFVDLFLFDIKETDEAQHIHYTGQSYKQIHENLRTLNALGKAIRMRCPIILGVNDRESHFDALVALYEELEYVEAIQLMPYHDLGIGKKSRYGLKKVGESFRVPTQEEAKGWQDDIDRKVEASHKKQPINK